MALAGTCGSQHRCGISHCFGTVFLGSPRLRNLIPGTGRRRVGGGICLVSVVGFCGIVVVDAQQSPLGKILGIHRFGVDGFGGCCTSPGSK